jgi:phospholipase C
VLRFLERLTGVAVPNLSAWRRATFGDLTSALGAPAGGPVRLPDTKAQLTLAVDQVTTLPPVQFPGAGQTPPIQRAGPRPRPRGAGA